MRIASAVLTLLLICSWVDDSQAQLPVDSPQSQSGVADLSINAVPAKVSLNVMNDRLGDVLNEIINKSGLRLSYSSDVVPVNEPVSVRITDQPALVALDHVLAGTGIVARPTSAGHVVLVRGESSPSAAVQTGAVEGTVRDASTGESLPGANVLIQGTNLGASTGPDGTFRIAAVPAGNHTIEARFIGYRPLTRQITVAADETITVDLAMSAEDLRLDEVVVTGTAGDSRRRSIGNAVSRIDAAELTEVTSVGSVNELLQARTPGLTMMPGSGTAGAAPNIRLRGASSLSARTSPVVYIDGIRMNTGSLGNFSVYGQTTSLFDNLNPEDIESIEVIKGPAAATLYGAEAAAGVIQVITKRGRMGERNLRYGATFEIGQNEWGVERPTNYAVCTAARIGNPDGFPGCVGRSEGEIISHVPLSDNPEALRAGAVRRLNLSAQGGGEQYSFFLSGGTDVDEGVFHNNFSNSSSLRGNFGFFPSQKFDMSVSLNYSNGHVRLPLNDDIAYGLIISSWLAVPGQAYAWPGDVGFFTLRPEVSNTYDNQTRTDRFVMGAQLNYRPFEWFTNRLQVGYDLSSGLAEVFYAPDPRAPFGPNVSEGFIARATPRNTALTIDYTGTLTAPIGDDVISNTSFGVQYIANDYRRTAAEGRGLGSELTRLISSAAVTSGSETYTETRSLGLYLQEQLNWRDRLFGTAAVRMDNNSAFGTEINTVLYPKFSLSYVISEEEFMSIPSLDQLRLRAAWGQAGNSPGPFDATRTYITSVVTSESGSTLPALRYGSYGNPDLKPERATEIEVGFDAVFFNDRLSLEATYYNTRTRDALISVPVPPSTGFSGSMLDNLGEIANSGFEFVVSGMPVQLSNFNWEHTLALSTNKNELVSFGDGRDPVIFGIYAPVQRYEEGRPLGAFWASPVQYDDAGNLVRDAANRPVLASEQVYKGPSIPTHEISYSTTISLFGGLRLYTLFDYKGGHYQFNVKDWRRDRAGISWETVNPDADPDEVAVRLFPSQTDLHVQPADFLKWRNLSLTYALPQNLLAGTGLDRASLTLSGHNLAVLWTRYGGADPEVNFHGSQTFSRVDSWTVPQTRRLSATLRIDF